MNGMNILKGSVDVGVSLYYDVERDTPLTEIENNKILDIVKQYGETSAFKGDGDDFCVYDYDSSEPKKIFSGATKLPMTEDIEAMFNACLHWAECLSEIRRAVNDGVWSVHLDDTDLLWDKVAGWCFSDEI